MPPVVQAACFAIRKPAVAVFSLEHYAAAGIMTLDQAEVLRTSVAERRNILVAGGTSTGKTTLVNALLAEIAKTSDRVVLIEDTRELQCAAPNLVALRTKDGVASLSELVRSSLRLRPDRIPIGEVRGAEALDLLKAWGTGHPGGVGTIHAGSALGALRRMEQLIQEAVVTVPRALIAETIDLVAVLAGRGGERRLAELARVAGLSAAGDYLLTLAGGPLMSIPLRSSPAPPPRRPRRCKPGRPRRRPGPRRRVQHALGGPAQLDPAVDRGASRQDHRGDHHHRDRPDARLRRHLGRLAQADPDRLRPLDRLCGVELLPVVLLVRRRGAGLMPAAASERGAPSEAPGFEAPVHRSLAEPILMGGAPRSVAILNGTLAAALGLGLRLWNRRAPPLGGRSRRRGLGRQARSAVRRRGAPPPAHPEPPRSLSRDDAPRRIPLQGRRPC